MDRETVCLASRRARLGVGIQPGFPGLTSRGYFLEAGNAKPQVHVRGWRRVPMDPLY